MRLPTPLVFSQNVTQKSLPLDNHPLVFSVAWEFIPQTTYILKQA